MKASEITEGSVLRKDGKVVYTVEIVEVVPNEVRAMVRYADGGTGARLWNPTSETPLTKD